MRAVLPICALILAACVAEGDAGNRAEAVNADRGTNVASPANRSGASTGDPDRPISSDDPPAASPRDAPSPDCPVIRSSGWRAHVNAMPGPNDNPRLIVSGQVTVPTGGYRVSLSMGQVAESYPVQVTVYLDATPPTGMASQALVTHDVRGNWPSEKRVGSVTVRCASRLLARIDNVGTAH
jgi:hypothetical protein